MEVIYKIVKSSLIIIGFTIALFLFMLYTNAVFGQSTLGIAPHLSYNLNLCDYSYANSQEEGISIIRLDPNLFNVNLESLQNISSYSTARDYQKMYGADFVINPGMFDMSGNLLGYAKENGILYGKKDLKDGYNVVLLFDVNEKGKQKGYHEFMLLDLELGNSEVRSLYNGSVQGLRMMDSNGRNVWSKQDKRWSVSCIAQDTEGYLYLIHSFIPYEMNDFVDRISNYILLNYNATANGMMYLEGGPEASLSAPRYNLNKHGSYETDFMETCANDTQWSLPNALMFFLK